MQKARRHHKWLRPLVGVRFQVLFHSPIRSTFHLSLTVLVHYRCLRSIQPYRMVPAVSRRISPVPRYSGYCSSLIISTYGAVTLIALLSKRFSLKSVSNCSPTTPQQHAAVVWALPCSLATTQGIISYFLFLWVLRCFSSPGWLSFE